MANAKNMVIAGVSLKKQLSALSILLVLCLMAFLLGSCGDFANFINSAEASNNSKSSSGSSSTLNVGATTTLGDWKITLSSYKTASSIPDGDYGTFTPDSGNLYVVVSLTVKNIGKSAATFLLSISLDNDISAKIVYQGSINFSATDLIGYDKSLLDYTINPLSSKSGVIVFDVISDAAKSKQMVLTFTLGGQKIEYALK